MDKPRPSLMHAVESLSELAGWNGALSRFRRPPRTWLSGRGPEQRAPQSPLSRVRSSATDVAPEGLTNNTGFKQWGRSHKLVAGANEERFTCIRAWAEARGSNAPRIVAEASDVVGGAATLHPIMGWRLGDGSRNALIQHRHRPIANS